VRLVLVTEDFSAELREVGRQVGRSREFSDIPMPASQGRPRPTTRGPRRALDERNILQVRLHSSLGRRPEGDSHRRT
jgi:hypothetical protein